VRFLYGYDMKRRRGFGSKEVVRRLAKGLRVGNFASDLKTSGKLVECRIHRVSRFKLGEPVRNENLIFLSDKEYGLILYCLVNFLNLYLNFKQFPYYFFHFYLHKSRGSSIVHFRNRCCITNRSHGVFKFFGLNRAMLRSYADNGQICSLQRFIR
jgi:ribosomal protein S14